ncbi:hypothetical protein BBK36DRAFT_1137015 [Trichoderma citrinoviride]|uniref:Uncharacterized protein n=1 Tax=Trichoderma citrinoviride TaxID=58853 RepID=A0A2T4BM01_9HYPO|nr:hypothetical protein BBK36DRAFT_1137015 [Trichoderma citrinoviride]PTB70345.1 hypothetical protein BBK36DRAFT_1137015 [Trichoderma citrinoviride]
MQAAFVLWSWWGGPLRQEAPLAGSLKEPKSVSRCSSRVKIERHEGSRNSEPGTAAWKPVCRRSRRKQHISYMYVYIDEFLPLESCRVALRFVSLAWPGLARMANARPPEHPARRLVSCSERTWEHRPFCRTQAARVAGRCTRIGDSDARERTGSSAWPAASYPAGWGQQANEQPKDETAFGGKKGLSIARAAREGGG